MRSAIHSVLFLLALAVVSCKGNDIYAEKKKTLDSLSGAVNVLLTEIERNDTILIQKAITKFVYYKQFIKQNVNDTLTKAEADLLQQFFASGKNIETYAENRKSLRARAALLNSQIRDLSEDLNKKTIGAEALSKYCAIECLEASKLVQQNALQKEMFYSSLQEFKNSINGVEQIIRSRNAGELPKIIKDTIAL